MKKAGIVMLAAVYSLICCLVLPVSAQENKDLKSRLDDEFRWLREEAMVTTQIATKTEMDADLVPGMVTVLKGKDLEDQGFRTVGEALVLVPGIDLNSGMTGSTVSVIRGITSSVKIKMLLNGVPMNSAMEGSGIAVFYIPIEQVERIEVIRGPGSGLYGEWAYLGVINVKTYQKGNQVFGRVGSYDFHSGGIRASYECEDKNFRTSLNIAGWERDSTDIGSGPDMFGITGNIDNSIKSPTAILSLDYKKLSIIAQLIENRQGNNYGLTGAIPPADEQNLHKDQYKMLEARLNPDISTHLTSEIKLGWREYVWDSGDFWLYPAGVITPYDSIGASYYEEQAYYGSILFHWTGWQKQHWLIGAEYEDTRMEDVWMKVNYDPISYEPVPYQTFTGSKNWMDEDNSRKLVGMFVQDQIDLTEQVSVTAGLRYDRYEDGEYSYSRVTPRIAGVFRVTDSHIFKIQYAEAFRPPSFSEMYSKNNPALIGNPELDFESVRTYEAEYIYRAGRFIGKFTVFYSEMDNLIYTVRKLYSNMGSATSKGVELEGNWRIIDTLTVNANMSFIDTEDDLSGNDFKNSPRWLSNAGLIWQPQSDWTAALNYRHVDKRNRVAKDPREPLDGYDTLNLTLSRKNLFYKGLTVRGGIKNLSDEDVLYPGNYNDYKEDYLQIGREWWVQLSYEF
jgi:iron complex outermembrane receptor protein